MITITTQQSVKNIIISRPDKKNALTLTMYQQMADTINSSVDDHTIKVIVLSGQGKHFSAGNDLADFLNNPDLSSESAICQFLQAIITCPLPIIAAVKGYAIGVGATMLLHCEQVFADETASFIYPAINLGLVPEAGSTLLLPQLIGYQKAAHLLLSGDPITATDAAAAGIVAQLIHKGDVLEHAMNYAQALAQKPRTTLIKIKRLLRADETALQQRLTQEIIAFKETLTSPEALELMTAFMEKRKPTI